MMSGVGGVRKSIHQSWLDKGLGLGWGLLCWGFKEVQEDILSEEASTRVSGISSRTRHQYTAPSLSQTIWTWWAGDSSSDTRYSRDLAPCDFWLSPKLIGCSYETIEEMEEVVTKIIDMLTQEDFHWAFRNVLE